MEIITLSFNKLGVPLLDGIPEFVEITTNLPAMIFFTLDGTLPTLFSNQYVDPVKIPTDSGSVDLSAIAYTLDGYGNLVPSSVLSETYSTDNSIVGERIRRLDFAGVVYIYPGGLDIPFWYDSTGEPSVFVDVAPDELRRAMTPSERDIDGSYLTNVPGGVVRVVPSDETPSTRDDPFVPYSTPSDDPLFDPNALLIVIDGRESRDLGTVQVLNGPYMSLRDPKSNFNGLDYVSTEGSNYISGSLTKAHYDRKKGIIVFYYFDSNTTRWIKSIQNLPSVETTIPRNSVITPPIVYKWKNWGRYQSV